MATRSVPGKGAVVAISRLLARALRRRFTLSQLARHNYGARNARIVALAIVFLSDFRDECTYWSRYME